MVSKEEFDKFKKTLISDKDKGAFSKKIKRLRIIKYILWVVEIVTALVFIVVGMTSFKAYSQTRIGFTVTAPIVCAVAFLITTLFIAGYEKSELNDIKSAKLPEVLKFLIGDKMNSFSMKGCVSQWDFKNAGFSDGDFDSYNGTDLLSVDIPKDNGQKSGVAFQVCDLNVTKTEIDSDGDSHEDLVYSGAFCAVEFPTNFKCRLAINSSPGGVKKFKLEDMEFNRIFQVFTDNKVEALCILTPTMMQKLMKLYNLTNKSPLKISLFDNHLYIAFPSVNLFEMGKISGTKIDDGVFDQIYNDVGLVLAIVDEIKSNNKVFKI